MVKVMRSKELIQRLGISMKTLERLESDGIIKPIRKGRTRFYTEDHINDYLGLEKNKPKGKNKVKIGYYRVSTQSQKKEMKYQMEALEQYSLNNGIVIDEYLFDVGSGINFKRKNFLKIMDMIENQDIDELVVTYKDRLTRFGFELIEERCKVNNVKLTVINIQSTSPQEELVEDLMTIIHVFSSRLYGLRKYKKKIRDDLDE